MESVTMVKGRTMEEPGSCFLVQMKSDAVTSTWVDTSAPMVGMVAQEGISSGSVEMGMDEVGKAHGTWVGTLLEVDGRAPCTDCDADADADADGDADGQTSSWVSRNLKYKQTTVFIAESLIGRTFSCANNPPIPKAPLDS